MFVDDIADDDSESDAGPTLPSNASMQRQSQDESRIRHNGELKGPRRAKLEADIKRVQQHYDEQEKVLKKELATLERRYKWTIAELEREGQDEYYFVDGCDAQSDYQPTECGEGSGSPGPMQ
jgi:hypothetical protein